MRVPADRFLDRCATAVLTLAVPGALLSSFQTMLLWTVGDVTEATGGAAEAATTARLASFAVLVVSVLAILSAVGVRRRQEWGRRALLGVILLAAGWFIASITFLRPSLEEMTRGRGGAHEPEGAVLWGGGIVLGIGLTAFLGWVFKQLTSTEVRAEFNPSVSTTRRTPAS